MKKLLFAFMFIIFMLTFIGCTHEHTFSNADCLTPKTCTECGETEGVALGHKWTAATCTTAKKCANCGKTEGNAIGHTWKDATCTKPKTCTKCNATSGDALGHTTGGLNCSRCGVSTVIYYKEYPSVPDFGAMFGISVASKLDPTIYGYTYSAEDVYNAAGSNAISQYTKILKAAGFSYGTGTSSSNYSIVIYKNKTSGLTVSIKATTISTGSKFIDIDIY